jgi:acyl-CoA synthetase (AMP-forming)/AMP-acid ligase II
MLIHQLLQFHARSFAAAPMLIGEGGHELSFAAGLARTEAIARLLLAQGLVPGDRVAILGENSMDHILILFGAAMAGMVAVPLNFRLAPRELEYILVDAEARMLVVPDRSSLEKGVELAGRVAGLRVFSGAPGVDGVPHWEAAQAAVPRSVSLGDTDRFSPTDVVLQLYTSGTTGFPKGVQLTHANIVGLALHSWCGLLSKPGPGSRELVIAPLFHVGGICTATNTLLAGGAVLLHRSFDPERVMDALEREHVTAVFMVPAMIQAIVHGVAGVEKRDVRGLKRVSYGAAPISESLLARAIEVFNCEVVQYYGMTETCGGALSMTWPDHQAALAGRPELLRSCGRAMAGVGVRIVGVDGTVLPQGETGEIAIRSTTNMKGYWKLPDETRRALRDGWVYTGDAGYMDTEGFVYLRDRMKDLVITGGENVYPVEVERVLGGHPSILEVAVIGVPDERFGEALLAVAVLRPGATLELDELVAYARDHIAGYKIPRQLTVVEALPRNASGKLQKAELRAPYWAGRQRPIG